MTHKIGSLIIDIEGQALTAEDRELITHPLVGGMILFSRNYATRRQLHDLCRSIRAACKKPLLIMVDQEGGRVQRFRSEFTPLPPLAVFGKNYDTDPHQAWLLAKDGGWLMASELLSVEIDLSLAPVLDLNKGISSVIGDRAFHSQPEVIIALATAYIQGMAEAGMASIGKHFPGHGSVNADSHAVIPVDMRSMNEIEKSDMVPFARLINDGLKAIMCAHIVYPHVDTASVGFSQVWLQQILRKKLAFTGTIFSDDLNMEGANISSSYADRVQAAREAGCDFTLLCNNRKGVIQVLDKLAYESHLVSKEKWGPLQGKFSNLQQPLHEVIRWVETHESMQTLSSPMKS